MVDYALGLGITDDPLDNALTIADVRQARAAHVEHERIEHERIEHEHEHERIEHEREYVSTALVELVELRPAWHAQAACRGDDHRRWFPARGQTSVASYQHAKDICSTCPVQPQCLEHALSLPENEGVWAGTSPRQRMRMRRARCRGQAGAEGVA